MSSKVKDIIFGSRQGSDRVPQCNMGGDDIKVGKIHNPSDVKCVASREQSDRSDVKKVLFSKPKSGCSSSITLNIQIFHRHLASMQKNRKTKVFLNFISR